MYQAKLYVDFDTHSVLGEVTREFDEPFDVLEEEVHDDGTITFVIQTRGHQDHFVERLSNDPDVYEVEHLGGGTLLVRKEAAVDLARRELS